MSRWQAFGLLLLANTFWGGSYVVAKFALEEIPPTLLGALRFVTSCTLLWTLAAGRRLLARQTGRRPEPPMEPADRLRLMALGVVGIGFNHLLGNWGVNLTTATDAALMIVGEVIFTSLLAALLVGERLGRWRSLGVVAGIAGVVVLVLRSADGDGSQGSGLMRALGDLLMLAGLMGEAAQTVLGSRFASKYRPLTVLTWTSTGSLAVWLPILVWHLASGQFPPISWAGAGGVLYLAAIASVGCFLIWFGVLARAGANAGAISLFVQPLVGAVLGIAVMGDRVTPGLLLGGGLVLLALYLSTLSDPPKPAAVPSGSVS